jgi:hypothetical protein
LNIKPLNDVDTDENQLFFRRFRISVNKSSSVLGSGGAAGLSFPYISSSYYIRQSLKTLKRKQSKM